MDWLDLLAVQGTLKSLLQHHSSKASIFQCSAFLIVQLSHPYMTTGKTIALTRRIFVVKVMFLLFNMFSSVQFSHSVVSDSLWPHESQHARPPCERLLLNYAKMPGFLASRGEEFNLGPEMRLDRSELLCKKVLLKYKGNRESFWHRHQKGVERVPLC